MSLRFCSILVAVLLAAGLRHAPASAQTVLLRVTGSDTSAPIFGALAHLIDDAGLVVRSVLTDERGRALFVSVPSARYRVRAEMIGMATRETEPFDVTQGEARPLELTLDPRPIDLEGIDVRADRRRCTSRPSGEGLIVARLWEEARKALSAAALTERQGLYRYETMKYERDLDPTTRLVVREEESRRDGYMRVPFESLPTTELLDRGFVQRDGAELVYYAPDANVLLSDEFLDTHCFRLAAHDDVAGVVGLGFEPLEARGRVVDVSGTLWLDEGTVELRWLEYSYTNMDSDFGSSPAGGRVEFQRMPTGMWIVPEWWIQMPIVGARTVDRVSRSTLLTLRQAGGRVVEVHEGGGRSLGGRRQTGGIEGVVVDSVGAPLAGARVGVVGGSQEVFTDGEGRFGLLGMSEGKYQVRFVDPRLVAVGLVPPPLTREVLQNEVSYVEFHMPSATDLLREACAATPGAAGGALVGRVVDAAGGPWVGATVRVTWASFQGSPSPGQTLIQVGDLSGLEVTTGQDGAFKVCGVPRGQELSVSTLVDDAEVRSDPVTIAPSQAGRAVEVRRERETR